jgi:RNA polymerase sigma-70 factor, ECF subfamily
VSIAADRTVPRLVTASASPRRLNPDSLGDHLDRLYRAAWALCGSREDAEDLVQETYARVLQRPRMLRSEDDLGYLLRVLRNTHVSRLRAASRRLRPEPLIDEVEGNAAGSPPSPDEALSTRELFALIAALPNVFRDALVAVDVIGLSYREAGRALHVREATVTTRVYRARQRLARALEQQAQEGPLHDASK